MSSEVAIKVAGLSKCYQIYSQPHDRLKQAVYPRLQRAVGKLPKQYFREFWALKNVSFEIKKGETVGIVGKNGAGKSTLLQMICGTLNPSQGTVNVIGKVAALLELGAGFNPAFTGRENVYMNGAILGLTTHEIDRKYRDIQDFAEIGDFIDQPVNTYSSGMYVRLAFAVQVCLDPDVLLVDEALAVGDAYFVHRCFHRIRDMKAHGKTILFVSHDTGSVKNLCDRAIWIDEGGLRMEGYPDEVTTQYRAHLFGIHVEKAPEPNKPIKELIRNIEVPLARAIPEQIIPNVDLRLGKQRCHLIGVGLYSGHGLESITEVRSGSEFLLRMSFVNQSLQQGTRIVVGYALRSPRGEELGAVNTQMENMEIVAPEIGRDFTVRVSILLPVMHKGSYAITIAIATGFGERLEIEDRVENALVFQMTETMEVVGLIKFPSTFTLE